MKILEFVAVIVFVRSNPNLIEKLALGPVKRILLTPFEGIVKFVGNSSIAQQKMQKVRSKSFANNY